MKSLSALCVLVMIFGSILGKSEAKKLICRCEDTNKITATIITGKATNSCGEAGKHYCYVYAATPFCEVGSNKDAFEKCCNNYGEGVQGVLCDNIKTLL